MNIARRTAATLAVIVVSTLPALSAGQLNGLGANEPIAAASGGSDPSILVTMVGQGSCPSGYTFLNSGTAYYPVCATGSAGCAGAFSAARAIDLIICSNQVPTSTAFINLNIQCALCLRGTPFPLTRPPPGITLAPM